MSYLALARKWRPRRFEDVMGQNHVVKALAHALSVDRLHPAILLTGTRGIGKTTLARIIAKGLNCDTGVTAQPCGICGACKEVDTGRFVDLLEIDAASNTGVDNVRELIDNSAYSPARGRYKVYLIDEVHMLSKSAFNALLKTLEEPPPHVKFILATTDPQKLPITVLSRCLQFNLKRLPVSIIRDQLALVLGNENIEFEPGATAEIARAADGSMRDGLSLLDQAIAFAGGEKLRRDPIADMLGSSSRHLLFELLDALALGAAPDLLETFLKLEAQAPDYAAALNDLAAHLQRIAVLQMLPGARDDEDDAEVVDLAARISVEDAQLWYQISIAGRRDLPWAPDPRLGFEMTLLRMLAFRPDETGDVAAGASSAPAVAAPVRTPARVSAAEAPAAPVRTPVSVIAAVDAPAVPARTPVSVFSAADAPAAVPLLIAEPAPADIAALPWPALLEQLGLEGATRQLARQCCWIGRHSDVVHLGLAADAAFLNQDARRLALEQALRRVLGDGVSLRIDVTLPTQAGASASPAQIDAQRAGDKLRAAVESIENDPVVLAFKEHFGASVRPNSIQALDSQESRT